jgi:peptidoglycan/LPS O-acetylase OafA/YrhL
MAHGSHTIATLARGRDNNFNLVRAIAAVLVIYTHAFGATGQGADEPLVQLSGKSFGSLAVDVFFVVSGFLIAKSWDRSRSLAEFTVARVLRIYPALWVCVALCVLGIGAAFTTLPLPTYLGADATLQFVLRNLTILPFGTLGELPGVFDGHPEPTINLPLWTLPFELKMYVLLAALGVLRLLGRPWPVALLVLAAGTFFVQQTWSGTPESSALLHARFVFFFYAGSLAYLWRDRVRIDAAIALGCLLVVTAAMVAPWPAARQPVLALVTPYLSLYAALVPSRTMRAYNRVGDYSYGLYIYGFPVQQSFVALSGGAAGFAMSPAENLWYSLPVALLLAMLSWHLVEERALGWRHLFRRRSAQAQPEVS